MIASSHPFRRWDYGPVVVEIPLDAATRTRPPRTLAEVPKDWPRFPVRRPER